MGKNFKNLSLGGDSRKLAIGPSSTFLPVEEKVSNSKTKKISVIIPAYNEGSERLFKTLENLTRSAVNLKELEVVVVDGGCSDDTMQGLERAQKTCEILISSTSCTPGAGRGPCLNSGARVASGEILLFLHADTRLPFKFDKLVRQELANRETLLTAFEFEVDNPAVSSQISLWTNLRSRFLWLPYGDQALGVRRSFFQEMGGFAPFKMMEDLDFVSRTRKYALRTGKRVRIIPERATCSGRRWEQQGILKNTSLNWVFTASFVWGVASPDSIFDWYYGKKD